MKRFEDIRSVFARFHRGELSRAELVAAIALWQVSGAPRV